MQDYVAYLNGKYIPYRECRVHVSDRGFILGDVVFEGERTFDGKIFRLRDHLERLYRSLKYMRIDAGMTIDRMEELTLGLVERNEPMRKDVGDYWIFQFVTRGEGLKLADWLGVGDKPEPTVGIRVHPFYFSRYAHYYKSGAHVVFPSTRSYPTQCVDPKIKHHSRINFALAELEAVDIDPSAYPVLLDLDGNITESIGGNFCIVTKGMLRTPSGRSILQGISRMTVLELARDLGIPTAEQDLQPYDAYTADEAFLTTTSYCVLPVSRVDNRPIGTDIPGPITRQLLSAWSKLVGLDIVEQAHKYAAIELRNKERERITSVQPA